ncbi:MAG: HEAT repeat domain-containing protein, partial [Candidatus Omnitrophota bacterium]
MSLSLLEAKLKDAGRDTPESAIQALGNVYVALINQGKEVSLSLLEAELKNPYRDIREAATQALGNAYAALVGQGKMSLFDLEAKLKDPDQCIREIAIQALDLLPDLLYAASINRSIISDADYEKYLIWTQEKLPYDEEFVTKYLSSPNPRVFISKLKAGAQEKIDKGFDPNNEEETYLAFIGARINGIDMTFAEFKERLEELVKFDKAHPGYFSRLFSKAKTLRALEVSAEESRTLDASQVDTAVLDKNLAELMKIKEDLDSLEWPPEDFRDIKAFNINNLYRYFRKEQGKPKKLNVSISDMKQEISQNLPMFRKALFKLAKRQLSNKKIRDKCLVLMRNLIIADVLSDNALLDHMRFSDVEAKISAFKNFYENYKNHLPNSVNVKLERIKGLPEAFGELSEAVFNEIGKVKVIRQKGKDTYTLIPQGFLSVFRGRAGMIDCSFDADKGTPCTRAMHEDTIYYFVYKGKKLKGYVGLCVAKTAKGEKLLTIDTINSASLDGEELLTNLFKELNTLTQELGCTGIALPSDIKLSFNFDNKETIKKMRLYTKGKAIRAGPFHKDTWQFFTDMFGEDGYNSIEKGEFKLINIAPSSQAEPVWLFDKLLESDSSENVGEKIAQFVLNTDVDLSSERDVYRWFTGKMGFGDEKGHGEIISSEEGIEKWRKEFQEDYVPSITDDKGRLKKEYEWWGNWLEFFHPTDTFRYDYRIYFVPKDECVITTFRNLIEALKESGTGFKIKTINIEKEMNEKLLKGQARTRKDRIVMYFSKADADKIVELVYSYVSSHKEDFHDWEAYFGQRIVSGVPGVRIVSDPSKEMCEACDASDQTYNCVIARITVAVIQKILRDNKEVLKKKLSKRYMNEVDFIIELFIHYIGSEKSTRLKQKFGVDMIDEIFNPFIRDAFKVLSDHFGEKEFHRLLTDIYKEHLMGLGMDPSRVAFLRMQPDPAKPTAGSTEGKPASDENTTMDDSTNAGGMSVRGIGTLLGLCIGLYFDAPGLGIAIGFLADVITYLITRRIRRASREKSQGMYIPFHFPHTIKRAFKTEDIDTLEKIALGPDSKFPVYAVHALMRIALPEGDERSDKAWKAELALEKIVHEKPDLAETIVTTLLEIYRSGSSTGKYRTGRILSRVASNNPKLARKTVRAFEGILEQENLPNIEYDCAISAIKNFITSDNEIFSKSDLQVIAKAFEKREMKEEFYSKVADAFTSLAHVKPYLFADKSDKRTKHAAQVINILEKTLRKKGLEPKSYWYIIGALTEIIKKDHELIKTSLITALEDILKTKGLPGDVYQNAVNCLEAIHALKPPFAPIVFRTAEKVLKTENLDKEACERTAYLLRFLIKASPKIATRNTINILRVLLGKKDLDNYVIFTFCLGFIAENNPGLTEAAFRAFKDVLKTRGLTLEIFKSACTVLTNVAEKRPETVETVIEIFIEVLKTKGLGFDAYSAVTSSLESIFSEKTELITLPAIQRLKSTLLSEDIDPDARKALSALVQIISEILKEFSMAPPESLNLSTVEMLSALFPINGLSHTTYDNLANSFLIIAIKKPDEARKIVDILAEAIKIKGLKQYIREKSSSALTTITSIASDDLDDKELADKIVHTLSNILLTKDLEHSSYKIAGVSLSKIADNPEFTQKVVQILKNLILMKDLEKEANEEAIGSLANIVGKKPALSAEIVAFFEDILREEHPLDPETHKRAASCWLAIVQKNSDASPDKAAFLEKLDLGFLEFILAEDGLSSDVYDYAGSLLEKIAEDKTDEITKNTVTALLTALKRRDMEEGTYWKITACLKKIIEKTGSFNEAIETFCKKIYKEKDLNVETYRCAGRCIAAIFKEDENTRPEILEFLKEVLKTKSLDPSAYDGAACGLKDIVGVDVKSIDSSTCGLLEEVMSYDIPGLYLWAFYIFYIISYIPN